MDTAPLLSVEGLTLRYKTKDHLVTATYRVSFNLFRSDRFVVLGPSGCGKSTLLKAVGGYIRPTEGRIRLGNADVTGPGPDRVFVFQEFDQLLPWKTVRENIESGAADLVEALRRYENGDGTEAQLADALEDVSVTPRPLTRL